MFDQQSDNQLSIILILSVIIVMAEELTRILPANSPEQFVFIETISDKCHNHILHPQLTVVIHPSQHYTSVELSLIETHFQCQPLRYLYIILGPGWSNMIIIIHEITQFLKNILHTQIYR